jgi:hypothetical protein
MQVLLQQGEACILFPNWWSSILALEAYVKFGWSIGASKAKHLLLTYFHAYLLYYLIKN